MIVMHGETLWSPALQPMNDDDDTWMVTVLQSSASAGEVGHVCLNLNFHQILP